MWDIIPSSPHINFFKTATSLLLIKQGRGASVGCVVNAQRTEDGRWDKKERPYRWWVCMSGPVVVLCGAAPVPTGQITQIKFEYRCTVQK